jgi:hypothetical protein
MRQAYFIVAFILTSLFSTAQVPAKNVYAELSGPGGFLSFNYDTRLTKSSNGLGVRAGVGFLFDFYNAGYTVPAGLNYLVGKENNFLELGAGISFFHFKEKNQDSWFNFDKENFLTQFISVGYRYQPLHKNFTFRAGLCQFFNDHNLPTILGLPALYPSLSFGYSIR